MAEATIAKNARTRKALMAIDEVEEERESISFGDAHCSYL